MYREGEIGWYYHVSPDLIGGFHRRGSQLTTNPMSAPKHVLALSILPALFVSLLFYGLLGHRRDYLGHYAAGYGGTLSAIAIVLAALPATAFERMAPLVVVPTTLLCIVAGTVSEATVFRLAKFDEVDYCNQNLGAVVAGLIAIHVVRGAKPSDMALRCIISIGVIFLLAGAYFAVT